MPEGPSILIAAEEMSALIGKKVQAVGGNSREPIRRLNSQKLIDIGTWGKHLLLFFSQDIVKIHFLMWGSYSLDQQKKGRKARLRLSFKENKLYFYACSVKFLEDDIEEIYDWSADVLSPSWDENAALRKIRSQPREMICDVLMDQQIFAGVGNIIKNEVLFSMRLRPDRKVSSIKPAKLKRIVKAAHEYSWKFYEWKKSYELKKHWRIMRKKICPVCNGPVTRIETGHRHRLSHFCPHCQK